MKLRNIFSLILIMFIVTGCSVKYNVNINSDGSVDDDFHITFPSSLSQTYFPTTREYIEYMYNQKIKEYGIEGYNYNYDIGNDFSTVNMEKTHQTVENFLNSKIIKLLYSNISVSRDGDDIVVNLSGMNDIFGTTGEFKGTQSVDAFDIVLTSQYVIKDDNSDRKNALKGEYIWHFSPDSFGKNISFTVAEKVNVSAVVNKKYGVFVFPIVILAIFGIGYIIYFVFKRRFDAANNI